MKKVLSIVLSVSLLFPILPLNFETATKAEGALQEQLIKNGDFQETEFVDNNLWEDDQKPKYWNTWVPVGDPILSIDQEEFLQGDQSFRVNAQTPGTRAFLLQDVSVKKGESYKLSFWGKSENVDASWGGMIVRTQYWDMENSDKIGDGPAVEAVKGTNDWTLYELDVTIPKDADTLRIELGLETASGDVWFDDVRLVTTNLVQNGGFEEVESTNNTFWKDEVKPIHWDAWVPVGNPTLSLEQDEFLQGAQSLHVDAQTSGSRAFIFQDIDVIEGQGYKLNVWAKTEDVDASWGGMVVRTQYWDMARNQKIGDGPNIAAVKESTDWTLYELNMIIPEGTDTLRVELGLETASGKIWFDEVTLEQTGEKILTGFHLKENAITMKLSETITLTPVFTPEDSLDQTINWSSSNPDVVTVDEFGVVTAHDYGFATIEAVTQDGGFKDSVLISVESPDMENVYEGMREAWFNTLTGEDLYNPDDKDTITYISSLEEAITNQSNSGYWDTLNTEDNRSYLWDSLQGESNSAYITSAYSNLKSMAMAYSMVGSELYQNEELKNDILNALDWMYENRFNENKDPYGNWWDWEIGTPQIINDIVVLMYDDLTSKQIDNYIAAIDKFSPDPVYSTVLGVRGRENTGANLLDKALVVTLRGVIGNNGAKISQGRDSIEGEYQYVVQGDGVYEDGSLVQHSVIAYTGSYGGVWLRRTADMLYLVNDTPWDLGDSNVNNVFGWVSNSFEPFIYKGAMMDMVSGRAISREAASDRSVGKSTMRSLLRLAEAAPSNTKLSIKRMVKEWLHDDPEVDNFIASLPIYEANLFKSLMDDNSIEPRGNLLKNKVFAGMDRVVHLRDSFGFGISMFSDRISAFSYGNGENKKGWFTGAGMTYLYNGDLNHYNNHYWPTIDSYRLPGTTTDGSKGVLQDWKSYLNTRTWVGGTSVDELFGTAGMEFSLDQVTGSSLEGKKSWFMFDNEIVALGTDITSTDNNSVETIIENRQLNDNGDNPFTVNGEIQSNELGWSKAIDAVSWAHLEGDVSNSDIGFYFPVPSTVEGLREQREGSWNEINDGGSSDLIQRNYLSLAINHGENPNGENYAYVILPNKDATATEQYSKNPDIEIVSQTSNVHAVKNKTLGILAANFWNAGTVEFLTLEDPASVMVKEEQGELKLAVSDPTQKQETITIEIDREELSVIEKEETIEVVQTTPTVKLEVNVVGSIGKTHTITLKDSNTLPKLDKKELESLLTEANAITNDGEYTEESFNALQEAIVAAEKLLENKGTSQEEIDAQVVTLKEALNALEEINNLQEPGPALETSELTRLLESAKSIINDEKFTEESFNALQAAIAAAEKLLENKDTSQEEIDAATITLRAVMDDLQEKEKEQSITPKKEESDGNSLGEKGGKLPNTATNIYTMLLIGILLFASGFVLMKHKRMAILKE
ncbi:hyaluronate lyase [Evansella vedderi]|uniref:Hyaluronate lyase n=1 Tax=Evansella vedderi TaxID=38282 RepID=A0ABT9ZSB4_9BACI|nr:polysaccharide lyase family 8 super-sandwich domain-containing protein [Evansella vedderi]MDQ0254107.1 hyaluronate lyase [Evansella vedderi]